MSCELGFEIAERQLGSLDEEEEEAERKWGYILKCAAALTRM